MKGKKGHNRKQFPVNWFLVLSHVIETDGVHADTRTKHVTDSRENIVQKQGITTVHIQKTSAGKSAFGNDFSVKSMC